MTKKEFIEALEKADDYTDVYFYDDTKNRYYRIGIVYLDGDGDVILEEYDI